MVIPKKFIGLHLRKTKETYSQSLIGLVKNFPELSDIQIFVRGPKSAVWGDIQIEDEFPDLCNKLGIEINVHASYLCQPWSKPFLFNETIKNIEAANNIDAKNVVIHFPFLNINEWLPSIVGIVAIMKEKQLNPYLLMETASTIPDPKKSFSTPHQLNAVTKKFYEVHIEKQCGLCIDTAHIFASSVKISSYEDAKKYCDKLDTRILREIQLNGNSVTPGIKTTRDKHEIPMSEKDIIWGGMSYKESGCRAFIELGLKLNIPIIIEWTTRHSQSELRIFLNKIK